MPGYSRKQLKVLREFGHTIKVFRKKRKLSQEGLAEVADLHRSYVGNVEQGIRNISLLNIMKLAAALEVEPEDIFAAMPKRSGKSPAE